MPWTVKNPPKVAKNWTHEEKERCVAAANQALKDGKSDAQAIFACIHAAGKTKHPGGKSSLTLTESRAPLALTPLPFAGAIDSARRRGVVLPETYYGELTGLARALAFTVSRLATVDQIDRVLKALVANLEEGKTFVDFKREVEQDPDVGRLPRGRVETIFRTGVQTAYNRGRAEHHVRHMRTQPYGLYSAVNDSRVRPTHLAMHGTILPLDHPWWGTHYPSNGFNCRCSVLSISREEAERRGVTVDPPDARPDPGFDYSVMDDPALGVKQAVEDKRRAVEAPLAHLVPEGLPPRPALDDVIALGHADVERLFEAVQGPPAPPEGHVSETVQRIMQDALAAERALAGRSSATPARVRGTNAGAQLIREVSTAYPDTWTQTADRLGDLKVRFNARRGWQFTLSPEHGSVRMRLPAPFGAVSLKGGDGFIVTSNRNTALHEYAHRLQAALPELDDYFQQLHERRTAGEPLEKLRDVMGNPGYGRHEQTRKDGYINPYIGKVYPPGPHMYTGRAGALEVMAVAFETVLGTDADRFHRLLQDDRELFELTIGLLLHYDP